MTKPWTPEQRDAIDTVDTSVLVSAAAGSGKTAVLTERCVKLVAGKEDDTEGTYRVGELCSIDELLIVTFTDAAAAEMRARIGNRLRKAIVKAKSNKQPRLRHQLAMLDGARISTIHSFCRWLLNRYFSFVDLEPRMPLMDEHDAAGLKRDCVKAIFDDWSAEDTPRGDAFLNLLTAYGKSERTLQDKVTSIAAFLESHVDPEQWLIDARQRFDAPRDQNTLNKAWHTLLVNLLRHKLKQFIDEIAQFRATVNSAAALALFETSLTDISEMLSKNLELLPDTTVSTTVIDAVCRDIESFSLKSLPRIDRKDVKALPEEDRSTYAAAKKRYEPIKDSLKSLQRDFGGFTCADWAEGIARTAPFVNTLLDTVEAYRVRYRAEKRQLGTLDFSDLERYTLQLLQDEANGVATRMRDKFRHVLVDEFQDTNPVQAEILRLLSREGEDERAGNLFSVGDVKQSIYRFRLGEPELFLKRRKKFNDTKQAGRVIPLAHNFRSTTAVIDVINAIFARLMAPDLGGIDYQDGEQLVPKPNEPNAGKTPAMEVHILEEPPRGGSSSTESDGDDDDSDGDDLERIEREAYVIAERITALHADGVEYKHIAILLRSMKARMGLFLRRLQARGIPAVASRSGDLFDAIEVQDVIALLRVMDNAQQDIPVAAVLRSPLLGTPLTDAEFTEIRTCEKLKNPTRPFHAAIPAYADSGPDEQLRATLQQRLRTIDHWRTAARRRPIADVLWDIYEATGYLAYASGLEAGPRRRANLKQLHDYARKFGDFQRLGLSRFLQFLETVKETGSELDAGTLPPAGDAVQIMTIHASKGLEFPVVILAEAGKKHNMRDAYGAILQDRELGIGMAAVDLDKNIRYPTLPQRVISDALKRDALAEEMRVLYVALTRAEERIIVVGTGPRVKEESIEGAREINGPLPLALRSKSSGYLSWIVESLLTMPSQHVAWNRAAEEGERFEVRQYDDAEIATWSFAAQHSDENRVLIDALASLQPVDDSVSQASTPLSIEDAQTLERRLLGTYRHDALTRVPAVAAASELKRRWEQRDNDADSAAEFAIPSDVVSGLHTTTTSDAKLNDRDDAKTNYVPVTKRGAASAPPSEPSAPPPSQGGVRGGLLFPDMQPESSNPQPTRPANTPFPKTFRRPSFLTAASENQPTQVGTWTHAFFEYADLHADLTTAGLTQQLDELITGGYLPPEARAALDIDAIAWFFTTTVGQRMIDTNTKVEREWPFTLGVDPTRYDPAATRRDADDIVLVRGIVDCLFDSGDGWEILDYKTDRVSGEELQARADLYAGQLRIYAQAVEAVWQQRPTKLWLAFLDAREMVEAKG